MGRPINKKFFGPDGAGFQILGSAWVDAAAEACHVVRQRSNRKFLMSNGVTEFVCKLVDGVPAALGEMQILVNGTESVRKLTAHRAYTFVGDSFVWSDITSADFDTEDSIDAELGTDGDDFENDPTP